MTKKIILTFVTAFLALTLVFMPATVKAESMEDAGAESQEEPGIENTDANEIDAENDTEEVKNGLYTENGSIYYYENGQMFTGGYKKITIDGQAYSYYFQNDGKAFNRGLLKFTHKGNTCLFYFQANGQAYTKGYKGTNTSYVASSDGVVSEAEENGTGHYYYFKASGNAFTQGLLKFTYNGKTALFYFLPNGQAYTEGYKGTSTSYEASSSCVVSRTAEAGTGRYYYFKTNGNAFNQGLLKFTYNGKTALYYFQPNGQAYTKGYKGTSTSFEASASGVISKTEEAGTGRYYYFKSNGSAFSQGMLKFTYNGNNCQFYFQSNGQALRDSLRKLGYCYIADDNANVTNAGTGYAGTYYFKANCNALKSSWKTIGDDTYYFGADGKAVTGKQNIGNYLAYFDDNGLLTRRIDKTVKMVAVTYDDGPSINTPTILDVLEANDSVATFFVVGERVNEYSKYIKRAYEMGCQIGNHTYNHQVLTKVDSATMISQISKTNDAVRAVIGVNPVVMRPPGGGVNSSVRSTVTMPMILWNIDTLDWKTKNASSTINTIESQVKDGDIILMHDLYSATAEASKTVIPWLVNHGYQLVTISELAECKGVTLEGGSTYYYFR